MWQIRPHINQKYTNKQDFKLLNNIINDIQHDDDDTDTKTTSHIIDDYNPLSPVYESNFTITLNNETYLFKTLLHFIYFNQYLELYKVYIQHSNHSELNIISKHTLAYNLLFKNSLLNIFEENNLSSY